MAEVSAFRSALMFFDKLGLYDVVLPFLLVFTIVYALFEKTKVFGTEEHEGKKYTRKNMNAMASFVIAFFVVASSQLVQLIFTVSSQVVILLFLSVFFLLLVGSFHTGDKEFALEKGWKSMFMVIMFLGIALIFLNALGWLGWIYRNVLGNFDSVTVSSIVLILVFVGVILYIMKDPKPSKSKGD
ncbi:MAG: hypothetical protein ABIA93_01705 [Candidatus Woesearchaeota archaeon]